MMIQSDELHHFSGGRSTTNQSSYPHHIPIQCHCHSLLHGRPEDYARDGYDATQVCCACGSGTVEAGNVPFASQDRVLSYAATGGTPKKVVSFTKKWWVPKCDLTGMVGIRGILPTSPKKPTWPNWNGPSWGFLTWFGSLVVSIVVSIQSYLKVIHTKSSNWRYPHLFWETSLYDILWPNVNPGANWHENAMANPHLCCFSGSIFEIGEIGRLGIPKQNKNIQDFPHPSFGVEWKT